MQSAKKLTGVLAPWVCGVAITVCAANGLPLPATADGSIVLKANATCEVGELVRLDASESQCEGLTWRVIPETPDFEVVDGGRRAMFSARAPGQYLVLIAGASGGNPHLHVHPVVVAGGVLPDGSPPPTPVLRPLGPQIASWLALVKDSPTKKDEAKKIAQVFRTLATTDLEVSKILEATANANRTTLGKSLEAWVPFLDALGNELDAYIAGNKLGTKEQYQKVWTEIADGLEKAAG